MKKIIALLFIILPLLVSSQTRLRISGFSNYDAWTHMDPFYLDEPVQDADNVRPVEYEERVTELKFSLDSPIKQYGFGYAGVKIHFVKGWANRKHTEDGDEYFEYSWPMTPYQTKRDYLKYAFEIYYGGSNANSLKPYIGIGGEFKIEQIGSTFIYLDDQTNAASDPIMSIPIDEHLERRVGYYLMGGVDYRIQRHFYICPFLKLYFNEVQIDEKMKIKDRTDAAQFRTGIEVGFIF